MPLSRRLRCLASTTGHSASPIPIRPTAGWDATTACRREGTRRAATSSSGRESSTGRAELADTAPLRLTVRGVWYPFEAETGLFYTGTTLGARRIVSVGASVDHQDGYTAAGADVFVDQPLAAGARSLTGQVNYTHYDGGLSLAALPHQEVWLVEAGMYDKATRLGPFAQLTTRRLSRPSLAAADESKVMGGLAYWAQGHRFNVKLGVARATRTGAPTRTQVVVQGQLYVF